jgi:UrcA family protein
MFARTKIAAPLAAIALTVLGAPAFAGGAAVEQRSMNIDYRDLDLTKESGVAALNRRIARAADAVCGPVEIRNLQDHDRYQVCRAAAIAAAVPTLEAAIDSARRSLSAANANASVQPSPARW